jgi:HSP20 family protein
MAIVKWTPMWDSLDEFDKMWEGLPAVRPMSGFVPSMDIFEDKENVFVETPLAGLKPENVKISIENDVLTVEGQIEKKSEVEDKNYYRKEVRYGSFHRSVALPAAVKNDQAKATYEDGILKISIPKEEKAKSKTINIEVKKKN